VRWQDPGAPGALLEPPDSPDRNLTGGHTLFLMLPLSLAP